MWILTDTGFISIVQHNADASRLLVRARVRGDLEAFEQQHEQMFGEGLEIEENRSADYRWRTAAGRERVAAMLQRKVMELDYVSHVKDVAIARSVPNPARPRAYYDTWNAMCLMQDAEE